MSRTDFMNLFHTNIDQFNQVGTLLDEHFDYFTYIKNQRIPTDGLFVVDNELVGPDRELFFTEEEWAEINDLFCHYKWNNSITEETRPPKVTTEGIYFYYPCKVRLITLDYTVLNGDDELVFFQLIHARADDIHNPSIELAAIDGALQCWRDLYHADIYWTGEGNWYVYEQIIDW